MSWLVTDEHPYRLPRAALPRHYELTLEPDLDAASFTGEAQIDLDVVEAVDVIVLNAAELDIRSASVVDAKGEPVVVDSIELDEAMERARVRLGRELPLGNARLSCSFAASVIRSGVQGGSQTTSTFASLTSSSFSMRMSIWDVATRSSSITLNMPVMLSTSYSSGAGGASGTGSW